jgi:hypothetical protein
MGSNTGTIQRGYIHAMKTHRRMKQLSFKFPKLPKKRRLFDDEDEEMIDALAVGGGSDEKPSN